MTEHGRALAFVHASVVLWGFTAILGKLISLPAAALVWWRMLLVAGMLAVLPRVWRGLAAMPPAAFAVQINIADDDFLCCAIRTLYPNDVNHNGVTGSRLAGVTDTEFRSKVVPAPRWLLM